MPRSALNDGGRPTVLGDEAQGTNCQLLRKHENVFVVNDAGKGGEDPSGKFQRRRM